MEEKVWKDSVNILDILNIDENIVDNTITSILHKSTHSIMQIQTLTILIKYKKLLNTKEDEDCDNKHIVQVIMRHILNLSSADHENFPGFSDALRASLDLDIENLGNLSEHFLQQLLSSQEIRDSSVKRILYLKVVDCVLQVCIQNNIKISSRFMIDDLNFMIMKPEDFIETPLFSMVIPKILTVSGEPWLLNLVWDFIISKPFDRHDYIVLCTLSDYYFSSDLDGKLNMLSSLANELNFWLLIRDGFANEDAYIRKCSICLAQRAVSSVCKSDRSIIVSSRDDPEPIILYNPQNRVTFEKTWNDLFALLESLEEKQCHLVLSAMLLFEQLRSLHDIWYCCALGRALNHTTESVKIKAIETTLLSDSSIEYYPIDALLEALNNVFIYENATSRNVNPIIENLLRAFERREVSIEIVKRLNKIRWSPIAKFHVVFAMQSIPNKTLDMNLNEIINLLCDDANILMNNSRIQHATDTCLVKFIMKNVPILGNMENLLFLLRKFDRVIKRNTKLWLEIVEWIKEQGESFGTEKFMIVENLKYDYSLAKLTFLLKDAGIISHDSLKTYINNAWDMVDQLKDRLYSIKTESLLWFYNTASLIENIAEENEYDNDSLTMKILYFFSYRLLSQNIQDIEEANIISDKLDKLLSCPWFLKDSGSLDIISINIRKLITSGNMRGFEKYFCIKALCALVSNGYDADWIEERVLRSSFIEDSILDISSSEPSRGKINCDYYEALAKLYYHAIEKMSHMMGQTEVIIIFTAIETFLNIGGYNCTEFVIKLFKIIYIQLYRTSNRTMCRRTIQHFWETMMEMRKSDRFRSCVRAFIALILVNNGNDEHIAEIYIEEIFKLGEQAPSVVYDLVIYVLDTERASIKPRHFNLVLGKALLLGNVLRKDQRVENELCLFIQHQYKIEDDYVPYISTAIRKNTVEFLSSSQNSCSEISEHIKQQLLTTKFKSRYHDNTTQHRFILRTFQLLILNQKFDWTAKNSADDVKFCVNTLTSQPHSKSVKILIEWFIILSIIKESDKLEKIVEKFNLLNLPRVSLLTVIYHAVKYQITQDVPDLRQENVTFSLKLFFANTMGSSFVIRLHAQYLFTQLLNIIDDQNIADKYSVYKDVIKQTLLDGSEEKLYVNLKNDFYINEFDPVLNLTVHDLYYRIPKLYNLSKEEWISFGPDDLVNAANTVDETDNDLVQLISIQKKFTPWKTMLADLQITVEDTQRQNDPSGNLQVVASLVDKMANLGGLSRTCEVFGVNQYAIGALGLTQNKEFQSLSVSSEKWLNIVEIPPGKPLKEYLSKMKLRGYSLIGVEQSSSSVSLQSFEFPKKSLILLGNEKQGIPCDLLNLMDHCVEIPQEGLIRSLNVHVAASVVIWEYKKQHGST